MPIMIRQDCICCRLDLYHCENCWNKYHNGESHKDYISPKYYGQPFFPEELTKRINENMKQMALKLGKEFKEKEIIIKSNKNRKYVEGEYH